MQVGVFDFEGALKRLGGDKELFREIVQFFFEDSPGLIHKLRCGLRDRNATAVERAAHALKGMAANFDAHRAVEAAYRVESLGALEKLAEVPAALEGLEEEVAILKVALTPYLSAGREV